MRFSATGHASPRTRPTTRRFLGLAVLIGADLIAEIAWVALRLHRRYRGVLAFPNATHEGRRP